VKLTKGDALLIIDVQNDFLPEGSLAVPSGDVILPVLNNWIRNFEKEGLPIYATRDWHPPHHISFKAQGGPWPPHCIQGSWGAKFPVKLKLPPRATVVSKGTSPQSDNYSAFDGTDLSERLKTEGIQRIWMGGLAQEVCVRASALDGLKSKFKVHLIMGGTRPLDPIEGEKALQEMKAAGVVVE